MLQFCLHQNLEELRQLCILIAEFAADKSLNAESEQKLNLILEELFVNFVNHSETQGGRFDVKMHYLQERILVEIQCPGVKYDLVNHPRPNLETTLQDREEGGLGIHLARELSTNLQYSHESGCNRISFEVLPNQTS